MEKRLSNTVCVAKAIGIMLIILGHTINTQTILRQILYGFHVPLFIIVSGIMYHQTSKNFLEYLKYYFKKILLPYYIFGFISIIVYTIMSNYIGETNPVPFFKCIVGLLWGNGENGLMRWNLPLWFLPMFFVIQISAYPIKRKKVSQKELFCLLFLSILIAFIVYIFNLLGNLVFGIETALYLLPFYLIGIIIGKNYNSVYTKLQKNVLISCIFLIVIFVVSVVIGLLNGNVDYVSDQYRIYPLFLVSASIASTSMLYLITLLKLNNKFLLKIGSGTLYIMLFHKFIIMFFERICPIIKDLSSINIYLSAFLISFLTIIISTVVLYAYESCIVFVKKVGEKV